MKDTGGPAFPNEYANPNNRAGMTLRDWFAGMAMQGLCAGNSTSPQQIAQAAYIVADAMLKERSKE